MTVRFVETIDTHTLGEPTRIVIDGFPELRGRTLKERSLDMLRRHGAMRRALMWEPRGHHVMFGAVVVPPAARGADLGLVFMDGGGAVDMCVHGTMGAVTALVETGRLNVPRDGVVTVDTPASVVKVRVRRRGKRVPGVEVEGVASRVIGRDLRARVDGREVIYDLAYGGNLIAVVQGSALGLKVEAPAYKKLVAAGMAVKRQAQAKRPDVVSALIHGRLGKGRYRDLVVFRDNSVDRSPCGSCVSAFMADLHAKHRLRTGDWIVVENLLGLGFRARLRERSGELIPELAGSAFITGEHRFRIDSADPLRYGFQLS